MGSQVRPVAIERVRVAVWMLHEVLIKQPVRFVDRKGKAINCSHRNTENIISVKSKAQANLIAADQLVVAVIIRVMRRRRWGVAKVVTLVDVDAGLIVDFLGDSEWNELKEVLDCIVR